MMSKILLQARQLEDMVLAFAYRLKKHDARLLATCEEVAVRKATETAGKLHYCLCLPLIAN